MPIPTVATLPALAEALETGRTSSRELVDACLERIADSAGEGQRAFISVAADAAREAASTVDAQRKSGHAPSPWAGIPVAIKDLADIAGEVTRAGSIALDDRPPANVDAPVVARMRAAGLIPIGRTNMTEFAYSGLGINPHYGTPASPWDRASRRIPGGSSSGSAVAVADGMAFAALGTDTGGSCRIPAAFNRITGYKPTARRVPTDGLIPLSTTLDSAGPIARSVDCCAILDAIMAGEKPAPAAVVDVSTLKLYVPETTVLTELDEHVAADFERTLARLSAAGAAVTRGPFAPFEHIPGLLAKGGFSAGEAWAWHHQLIERRRKDYDPRVLARISQGSRQDPSDYLELQEKRKAAVAAYANALTAYDAILSPTTPVVAPRIADVATDSDYNRINMLVLRNTLMINILDGCSIALPMSAPGAPPTSLMISAAPMADKRVLSVGRAVESMLAAG